MIIREYNTETDYDGLKRCVVSIQDYERNIDPRMPRGVDIVERYIEDMFNSCSEDSGKILVAELANEIAGYVLLLTKAKSDSIDDGVVEFGLIRDVVVLEKFRGQGTGGKLLEAAENEAKKSNVEWLRIEVLSANKAAEQIYLSRGFQPYTSLLEKNLSTDR